MKLEDKIALITGASTGIGRATALKFAEEGARVVINYKDGKETEDNAGAYEIKRIIERKGGGAYLIRADVSKHDEILSMVKEVIDKYGRIDILVNNASIYPKKNFFDYTSRVFDDVMRSNLKSVFFCSQIVGKEMVKQKSGIIINVSSNAGLMTKKDSGIVYGLSKAGSIYLTKCLALTLSPYVRVNCIAPGFTETQMSAFLKDDKTRKEVEKKIPVQRVNQPGDIANAALFLASEEARNITGQILIIDGGFILR